MFHNLNEHPLFRKQSDQIDLNSNTSLLNKLEQVQMKSANYKSETSLNILKSISGDFFNQINKMKNTKKSESSLDNFKKSSFSDIGDQHHILNDKCFKSVDIDLNSSASSQSSANPDSTIVNTGYLEPIEREEELSPFPLPINPTKPLFSVGSVDHDASHRYINDLSVSPFNA